MSLARIYKRPPLYPKQEMAFFNDKRLSLIEGSTKCGKSLRCNELVYTPSGPVEIGSLSNGDEVFAVDGRPTKVTGVFPQGELDVYRVTFTDGVSIECSLDHLWEINGYDHDRRVVTTEELMDTSDRFWVPRCEPVHFNEKEVPIDPYVLGVLLGDGYLSQRLIFSSADSEILQAVSDALGGEFTVEHMRDYDFVVKDNRPALVNTNVNNNRLILSLRLLGLWGTHSYDKFIPNVYKYNSIEVRKGVLRGLFDTDGWVNSSGGIRFEQTSEQLAKDVEELVFSFGGYTKTNIKENGEHRKVYRQSIELPNPSDFLNLPRKKDRARPKVRREKRRSVVSVEKVGRDECVCISVDHPRKLFLTRGFVPTHNTHAAIAYLFEQALINGRPGRNYWWVAPVSSQSEIAFRRMKLAIPHKDMYSDNKVHLYITLPNEARVWFKTGDNPDTLYGEDVHGCVIDEASRVKEDSWHAVRSTVTATRAPVRMIGNVKGRANWFYRLCRRAQQGHPDMYYDKITAVDAAKAGVLDWREILDAKSVYPENVFRELYLAEPSDEHGNPFGHEHIEACLLRDSEGRPSIKVAEGVPVAFGWDVAKSMNYTVGIGLNRKGEVCRFHRWRDNWDATLKRIISLTGTVPAYVDSTGGGDPIEESLQRTGGNNFHGLKFSRQSKQDLMVLLATAIQQRSTKFPDGVIRQELDAFEYEISPSGNVLYSAPKGVHDDCVDSLAMAYKKYVEMQQNTLDVAPLEIIRPSPWVM